MNGKRGFTLLEVMVALVILAVGASGLIAAGAHSLRQQQALETRLFASWAAQNRIAELRSARAWSDYGESDDKVTMAGREWSVHVAISATPNPGMRKVEVAVTDAGSPESPPLTVTGYLGRY